jgi:hypothetical protein
MILSQDTLTGDYLDLVNEYIQPMLIHFAMVDYLPFAAYEVKNNGLLKHRSENSETPSKDEIDFLTQKYRNFADFYTRGLSTIWLLTHRQSSQNTTRT